MSAFHGVVQPKLSTFERTNFRTYRNNPREFFGEQNANIELLKKYFPKLKIVARGNKIIVFGDEEMLEEFDKRVDMLVTHFGKYNKLDQNSIERILTSDDLGALEEPEGKGGDVLVHGVNGRLIRPQTANQRKLIDLMKKNDMVFAIGPAGTPVKPIQG